MIEEGEILLMETLVKIRELMRNLENKWYMESLKAFMGNFKSNRGGEEYGGLNEVMECWKTIYGREWKIWGPPNLGALCSWAACTGP